MAGSTTYLPLMFPSNIFPANVGNSDNPTIISLPVRDTISQEINVLWESYLWLDSDPPGSAWDQTGCRPLSFCPGAEGLTPPPPEWPLSEWMEPLWTPDPSQRPDHRQTQLHHIWSGEGHWQEQHHHSYPHSQHRAPCQGAWLLPQTVICPELLWPPRPSGNFLLPVLCQTNWWYSSTTDGNSYQW